MMEELSKTPTVELINRITKIDQQIDLKMIEEEKTCHKLYLLRQELALLIPEYESIRLELINRFPVLEKDSEFQPKVRRK